MRALKLLILLLVVCFALPAFLPSLGLTGLALSTALVALVVLCIACLIPLRGWIDAARARR